MTDYECKDCEWTVPFLTQAVRHAEETGHTLEKERINGDVITVSMGL